MTKFFSRFVLAALAVVFCLFQADCVQARLHLESPQSVVRGQAFFVRLTSDSPLKSAELQWMGKTTPLAVFHTKNGYEAVAMLGAGLNAAQGQAMLFVDAITERGAEALPRGIEVLDKDYPEQRLKVNKKYVDLSRESLERHYREKTLVLDVLRTTTRKQYLKRPFVRPLPGGVSSVFGMRRVFNDQPRKPHSGVDLRGRSGDPVRAFASGRVALVGDHFFSGKAVYLDHGQGVVSMYCHLSRIKVRQGQVVKAGQTVGLVGSTGRVTGPHLHFGLSVLGSLVDPLPLIE